MPWDKPPEELTLPADEVHIWRVSLDVASDSLSVLKGTLSGDELRRAGRFFFERDRLHFIAARGVLRSIIGFYLDTDPKVVRFAVAPDGKPQLDERFDIHDVRFNLSHSRGLALYAFTLGREIGVDLERIRKDFDWQPIADRFFTPGEKEKLESMSEAKGYKAFFSCWTLKEAYMKARGKGLALPPNRFEVTVEPTEPPALVTDLDDPEAASRWILHRIDPHRCYAAGLAVERNTYRFRYWLYSPGANQ
ncbi:MAG: 4'-phosphopantetheinyl transferase superfamily protein [bacterium]|nr:MAG: 4'-phosphopantetheinyl transferase superfamily protein [bacterium]